MTLKPTCFLYVASCNEGLSTSKVSSLPLGCNRLKFVVTASEISGCDSHTGLYDSWNCDLRQCETWARLLKKQFYNLLSILGQSLLIIPIHSFTVRKTSAILGAIVGCHERMVTMTEVSGNLLLYISNGNTVFPILNAALFT